jgi:NAD+--dinitrogen-reductase ADP-D-ribosyltransferase
MHENARPRTPAAVLPRSAYLPLNRCNLPAVILGGVTFQRHPTALLLDGVYELHREFFEGLDAIGGLAERNRHFRAYMAAHFCLDTLEDAGLDPQREHTRANANYVRLLRGWLFDPDGREGAVLKGWVESRFGLLPRHHKQAITSGDSEAYRRYMHERCAGVYNTNALEGQIDLLYSYAQYEFRRTNDDEHLRLYRGVNRMDDHEVISRAADGHRVVLLNNLSSFSTSRERADEFGDCILEARVPTVKVLYQSNMLASVLSGEDECLVIGGLYEVTLSYA